MDVNQGLQERKEKYSVDCYYSRNSFISNIDVF